MTWTDSSGAEFPETAGRFIQVFAAIGLNRAEYLALLLREQKGRIILLASLAAMSMFLGLLSAILGAAFVVSLFGEEWRPYVLAGLAALCGGAVTLAAVLVYLETRGAAVPFSSTLGELREDYETFFGPEGLFFEGTRTGPEPGTDESTSRPFR